MIVSDVEMYFQRLPMIPRNTSCIHRFCYWPNWSILSSALAVDFPVQEEAFAERVVENTSPSRELIRAMSCSARRSVGCSASDSKVRAGTERRISKGVEAGEGS